MRPAISLLLSISFPALSASAADFIVGPGDHEIQEAIASAQSGDTVLVPPGEYSILAPIDFLGKAITLKSQVGSASTVLRMSGDRDRASVVVFQSGEGDGSVLEGFTITSGAGTGMGNQVGGGILCVGGSHPTLKDLVVIENTATYGGGLYCQDSSPTLIRCTLSRNRVTCGGGAYCTASSPTFIDCTIEGNLAGYASSGVHSKDGSSPHLYGCKILGNSTYYGGGVDAFGGSPVLVNCVLAGNRANQGGAAYVSYGSSMSLTNCTIWGNSAWEQGGGIQWIDAPPLLRNCIITGNFPETVVYPGSNCMVRGDPLFADPGRYDFNRFRDIGRAPVSLPDFIVQYPDFNLREGSPAIDMGNAQEAPLTDLEGRPRACGRTVDIGAFEYCGTSFQGFRRGDPNLDGSPDLSDAIFVLIHLFAGEPAELPCRESADVNADQGVDISDVTGLLSYLFLNGDPPQDPFRLCGTDPSQDDAGCRTYPGCI